MPSSRAWRTGGSPCPSMRVWRAPRPSPNCSSTPPIAESGLPSRPCQEMPCPSGVYPISCPRRTKCCWGSTGPSKLTAIRVSLRPISSPLAAFWRRHAGCGPSSRAPLSWIRLKGGSPSRLELGMAGKDEKSALICGSVAYDTIMVFPDRFRTHILPDKLHMLNVAFLVPQMRREFGGCAGNIAYNLKLLGETCYPMGGIGSDFQPYREWFKKVGLSEKYLVTIPEEHCAQAFITTDLDANQITAFHPGAMNHSWKIKVPPADGI